MNIFKRVICFTLVLLTLITNIPFDYLKIDVNSNAYATENDTLKVDISTTCIKENFYEVKANVSDNDNKPVSGIYVDFYTTLGMFSSPTPTPTTNSIPISTLSFNSFSEDIESIRRQTDELGNATVLINSFVSGEASVTAVAEGRTSASTVIDFSVSNSFIVGNDRSWLTDRRILLDNYDYENINSNLNLPTTGPAGSTISWSVDKPEYIATTGSAIGTVTLPSLTEGNQNVELTALITYGEESANETFSLTILADILEIDKGLLTPEVILNKNSDLNNIKTDLNIIYYGKNGSNISWTSSHPDIVSPTGIVKRPTYIEENQHVQLTATLTYGGKSVTKTFDLIVIFDVLSTDINWLTLEEILNENININNIMTDLTLMDKGLYGSSIVWTSSNLGIIDSTGKVQRPNILDGYSKEVSVTATLTEDEKSSTKTFYLTVIADYVEEDKELLTPDKILKGNSDLSIIKTDLDLLEYGHYGSRITWTSSNSEIVDSSGKVHRPSFLEGNQNVVLIARLTDGVKTIEKVFDLTVLAEFKVEDFIYLQDIILNENYDISKIKTNLNLIQEWHDGSSIVWESANTDIVDITGVVKRLTSSEGNQNVELTSTLTNGVENFDIKFMLTVIADYLNEDLTWLTPDKVLNENKDFNNIISDLKLIDKGPLGSNILWSSSKPSIVDSAGKIQRPTSLQGNQSVKLTAILSNDDDTVEKEFDIIVLADILAEEENWLTADNILNGNSNLNNIKTDLKFVDKGSLGCNIRWTTSNSNVVSTTGKIQRPTSLGGNQSVAITATLTYGDEEITKTFNIIVIADFLIEAQSWLTPYQIKDKNSYTDNVIYDLNLVKTSPNGTSIEWKSSNTEIVDITGKVQRPIFSQGNQNVELTATLTHGDEKVEKPFNITVIAMDKDILAEDIKCLTSEVILNGNSDLNNVISDLDLIDKGPNGSNLVWSSSNVNIVDITGKVNRPTYMEGNKSIKLTAVVSYNSKFETVVFDITVIKNNITDEEIVNANLAKLDVSLTLGDNLSQYSITENIYLPSTGTSGTAIKWVSSDEGVISVDEINNEGDVTRLGHLVGHKTVTLTATINSGVVTKSISFQYTVIALPDTKSAEIIESDPINNSKDVPNNKNQIAFTFDEEVQIASSGFNEMQLLRTDSKSTGAKIQHASVSYKKLTIILDREMTFDEAYELIIPENIIIDMAGNSKDYSLAFKIEPYIENIIEIDTISIRDRDRDVPINREISFAFKGSVASEELLEGDSLNNIDYLYTKYFGSGQLLWVPTNTSLSGNTVIISLKYDEELKPNTVYQLIIPAGVMKDRYGNQSKGKAIDFVTAGGTMKPQIINQYPLDNQQGVSINQSIRIDLNDVNLSYNHSSPVELKDEYGNKMNFILKETNKNGRTLYFEPYEPLKPNTRYTLKVPYNHIYTWQSGEINTLGLDHILSFTTGDNNLGITKVYPKINGLNNGVNLNKPIELEFSASINQGPSFSDINLVDSKGASYSLLTEMQNNKAILYLEGGFKPSEKYVAEIPAGAFMSNNAVNDKLQINFTSAEKIDLFSSSSINVHPSAKWLKNKPISFEIKEIENSLKSFGQQIVSINWNLGDGSSTNEKSPVHTYNQEGEYNVTLNIETDAGVVYEVNKKVSINDYSSSEFKLEVGFNIKEDYDHVILKDKYSSPHDKSGSKDYLLYLVSLSYNNIPLSNEDVTVLLYKNGELFTNLGTYKTSSKDGKKYNDWKNEIYNTKGTLVYFFEYSKYEPGTYELVFAQGNAENYEINKQLVRRIVKIGDKRSNQDMYIRIYNETTGKYEDRYSSISFKINDETVVANRKYIDGISHYVFKNMPVDNYYHVEFSDVFYLDLYLTPSAQGAYHSDYSFNNDYNASNLIAKSGKSNVRIISDYSDSNSRNDIYFMKNTGIEDIRFNIKGNWGDYKEGYYEIKRDKTGETFTTRNPYFDFNPTLLDNGEKLLVRMVSNEGVSSPWTDTKVRSDSIPVEGMEVRYQNGEVHTTLNANIGGFLEGKMDFLNEVPFLDHSKSFGLDAFDIDMHGVVKNIRDKRYLSLSYDTEFSYSTRKNKPKMLVVGYDAQIECSGSMYLQYNSNSGKWTMNEGKFYLYGSLYKVWEKKYVIPKINVGVDGELKIGAGAGGTLYIDKRPGAEREYSAILHIEPHVYARVTVGPKYLNAEGTADGRVPVDIHIPTGYVEVTPRLEASIYGTVAVFRERLVHIVLTKSWDNGKEKVDIPNLMFASIPEDSESILIDEGLELIPRGYINRESQWNSGNKKLSRMALLEVKNPNFSTIKTNIYPYSEVKLIKKGEEIHVVWIDDNVDRSSINRTQLYTAVYKDNQWSAPQKISDDNTADFAPSISSNDENVFVAWQNTKTELSDSSNLNDFIENSEISVMDINSKDVITLTDDSKFDHSPTVAAGNDKAMVVWVKSDKLNYTIGGEMDEFKSGEDSSDGIYYSVWNGGSWSKAEAIEESMPYIADFSLAMNENNEVLLLYTLDEDNDLSTLEDQDIYARIYDGSTWGESVRITNDSINDSNPKAVYSKDGWFITWNQDGTIKYKLGLDGDIKTAENITNPVSGNYEALVNDEKSQIALVYKTPDEKGAMNLSAVIYDYNNQMWSDEVPLTSYEDEYIRSFSSVYTNDGKIKSIFSNAKVALEVKKVTADTKEIELTSYNPSDKVDLTSVEYSQIHDLSLSKEDGIVLSREIPIPSTRLTISATIENEGDYPEKATIVFYEGSVDNDNIIGEFTTRDPISARRKTQGSIEWLVDSEEKSKYEFYALVKSAEDNNDNDERNNMIKYAVVSSDVAVRSVDWVSAGLDAYLVTVTAANNGSKLLENVLVKLENNEMTKDSQTIEKLYPGQQYILQFMVSYDNLVKAVDGSIKMSAIAELSDEILENSIENNINDFVMEPSKIVVDSMSHSDGEMQAAIDDDITITFNMAVEEGDKFNEIILEDEDLNVVDAEISLKGDTLTIKMIELLQNDLFYTLTVPEDAVKASFGHIMENDFTINFKTITNTPEIIFTNPGNKMEGVKINEDIKVKYNQNIYPGFTSKNISLRDSNEIELAVAVSSENEWLSINPVGLLTENTYYTLSIPYAAVIGKDGINQQNDFTLLFNTGEYTDDDSETNDRDKKEKYFPFNFQLDLYKWIAGDKISINGGTIRSNIGFELSILKGAFSHNNNNNNVDVFTFLDSEVILRSMNIPQSATVVSEAYYIRFDELLKAAKLSLPVSDNSFVYYFDENIGALIYIGGQMSKDNKYVTAEIKRSGTYVALKNPNQYIFEDVQSGYWGYDYIYGLNFLNIINGYVSDNKVTFNPEGKITRAEFIKLLIAVLKVDINEAQDIELEFSDNDLIPEWAVPYIKAAVKKGLINGKNINNKYYIATGDYISREEIAAIIGRTISSDNRYNNTFSDKSSISSWAQDEVYKLLYLGIIKGYEDNTFRPNNNATRTESAVMIYNYLRNNK